MRGDAGPYVEALDLSHVRRFYVVPPSLRAERVHLTVDAGDGSTEVFTFCARSFVPSASWDEREGDHGLALCGNCRVADR